MRLHLWRSHKYTVDVYDYVVTGSGDLDFDYVYRDTRKVDFSIDPSAPRVIIESDRPLPRRARVSNVRDANGKEVLPGAEFTITKIDPILSVFSTHEGFRMSAALANDPTFEEV